MIALKGFAIFAILVITNPVFAIGVSDPGICNQAMNAVADRERAAWYAGLAAQIRDVHRIHPNSVSYQAIHEPGQSLALAVRLRLRTEGPDERKQTIRGGRVTTPRGVFDLSAPQAVPESSSTRYLVAAAGGESYKPIPLSPTGEFVFMDGRFRLMVVSNIDWRPERPGPNVDSFLVVHRTSGRSIAENIVLDSAVGYEGPIDGGRARALDREEMHYALYVNRDGTELLIGKTSPVLVPLDSDLVADRNGWKKYGSRIQPSLNLSTVAMDPNPGLAFLNDWVLRDQYHLEPRTLFSTINISRNVSAARRATAPVPAEAQAELVHH